MDELAENLANSFSVSNEPNTTDAPHPRFADYKKKTSGSDQDGRRSSILEQQKKYCTYCTLDAQITHIISSQQLHSTKHLVLQHFHVMIHSWSPWRLVLDARPSEHVNAFSLVLTIRCMCRTQNNANVLVSLRNS